jgi:glutaredoxin
MKPLLLILAICSLGYAADHWDSLTGRRPVTADMESAGLVIYGMKSCPACVQLENELHRRGIPFQERKLDNEASMHELTDTLARVGKMGGSIPMPVADINGIIIEGATIEEVLRKLK